MTSFAEWVGAVPQELTGDPLLRMEAYRLRCLKNRTRIAPV
jgi:hypothetical protein